MHESSFDGSQRTSTSKASMRQFLRLKNESESEINKTAKRIRVDGDKTWECSGLAHHESRPTVLEVGKLSSICLKDDFFRKVANRRVFMQNNNKK